MHVVREPPELARDAEAVAQRPKMTPGASVVNRRDRDRRDAVAPPCGEEEELSEERVRLAHGDGVLTSYSHMSRIVAEPGTIVRQGQLIGYVGSSGLSTGPHLHYEVYRGGVAVNPLSVRFASRAPLDPATLGAFKARLKALLSVGS